MKKIAEFAYGSFYSAFMFFVGMPLMGYIMSKNFLIGLILLCCQIPWFIILIKKYEIE